VTATARLEREGQAGGMDMEDGEGGGGLKLLNWRQEFKPDFPGIKFAEWKPVGLTTRHVACDKVILNWPTLSTYKVPIGATTFSFTEFLQHRALA
jgi:hypothetical protein